MVQCKYIWKKGDAKGTQCEKSCKKGRIYCYVHNKRVAKREETKQTAQIEQEKLNKGGNISRTKNTINKLPVINDGQRFSSFFVTINSNKNVTNMSEKDKDLFLSFCQYLFGENPRILNFFSDMLGTNDSDLNNLQTFECEYKTEIGETSLKLHCHSIINIAHTGNFSIRLSELKEFARQVFGYNLYINASGMRNTTAAAKAYIYKKQ